MEKISIEQQKVINEIDVKEAAEICGDVTRVCYPESYFDIIEQCKSCGRCV